jgi:hypothetical protein
MTFSTNIISISPRLLFQQREAAVTCHGELGVCPLLGRVACPACAGTALPAARIFWIFGNWPSGHTS